MAAIDFPASPTTGQTFTALNGVIYQWDSVKWVVAFSPTGMVAFRTGTPNVLNNLTQWTYYTPTFSATPLFNNGGGLWDGTTYTVKTAGLYQIIYQNTMVYPAAGSLVLGQGEIHIFLNGASAAVQSYNDPFWNGPMSVARVIVHVGYFAVNDLITLRVLTGNIGGVNLSAAAINTWLSVIRLGS